MFDFYGESELLVEHNGTVLYVPPVKLTSSCLLNLRGWPYDVQKCELILGSWTYEDKVLNLTLPTGASVTENKAFYVNNTEWSIIGLGVRRISKEYDCCPGLKYVTIHYDITVQRKSCTYSYLVVLPILSKY